MCSCIRQPGKVKNDDWEDTLLAILRTWCLVTQAYVLVVQEGLQEAMHMPGKNALSTTNARPTGIKRGRCCKQTNPLRHMHHSSNSVAHTDTFPHHALPGLSFVWARKSTMGS